MANPTTNYGWPMPTTTDLVTDLPADFALFGQPVDTSLKALNPETTLGDISFRSSTSNTNTRLGIGTAGQVLAVSGGVPAWTTTADVTPLTTKGDLFTFTTVDARIGVGANNTVLTADSAEASGLKWATPASNTAVSCSVYKSSQTISNNTFEAVTWDIEAYDTDALHSTASNTSRFTVPAGKAGKWLFQGNLIYATNATGGRYARIHKNGSAWSVYITSAVTNINGGIQFQQMMNLAVTDYVEVFALQDSGGSLTLYGTSSIEQSNAQFTFIGA